MWRRWLCAVGLGAAGCVSSGTWSTFHSVERTLEEEEKRRAEARGDLSDCSALAEHVVERFPSLDASRRRARAALARGRSEGALPAPEVTLEVWDFPIGDPQLADREGTYIAGITQRLPPGGALDGRARAEAEEAQVAIGELAERRTQLRQRALDACVAWAASDLEAERLRDAERVATEMRESLLAQVRAGGGASLAELARLDAELSRLARLRVEAEGRARRASTRLGAWMEGELPEQAPAIDAPEDQGSVERWIELALERHGALRAARARARAAQARADAARAEASVPTFMVGASYMQMPEGRPGLGASVGMTLPWLWSGEGAARDAAVLEAEAELDEVAALEREVRAQVRAAAAELHAASQALAELRERERPAAVRALETMAALYPSGAVELGAWLEAARRVRDLDVEEARLVGDVARAWATLEGAIGDALAVEANDE